MKLTSKCHNPPMQSFDCDVAQPGQSSLSVYPTHSSLPTGNFFQYLQRTTHLDQISGFIFSVVFCGLPYSPVSVGLPGVLIGRLQERTDIVRARLTVLTKVSGRTGLKSVTLCSEPCASSYQIDFRNDQFHCLSLKQLKQVYVMYQKQT